MSQDDGRRSRGRSRERSSFSRWIERSRAQREWSDSREEESRTEVSSRDRHGSRNHESRSRRRSHSEERTYVLRSEIGDSSQRHRHSGGGESSYWRSRGHRGRRPRRRRDHPFIDEVMSEQVHHNFRFPKMRHYDGTSDPQEHLTAFNVKVMVSHISSRVKCQVFPTTLEGPTLVWFSQLPRRSVYSWNDLTEKFLIQFATSMMYRKTSACLDNFKQEKHESLSEYVDRFTAEILMIKDLESGVALHSMRVGLREGPFLDSLSKRPAIVIDDLRQRASKYISMEEAREAKRKERADNQERKTNQNVGGRRLASKIEMLPRLYEPRRPKYTMYTPLNTTRAQILVEVCHAGFVDVPPPVTAPEWPIEGTAIFTTCMVIPLKSVWNGKIKLRNWFRWGNLQTVGRTEKASSVERLWWKWSRKRKRRRRKRKCI